MYTAEAAIEISRRQQNLRQWDIPTSLNLVEALTGQVR